MIIISRIISQMQHMDRILIKNWGISSQIIVDEARKLGYEVEEISRENNLFAVSRNGKKVYFKSVDCGLNTSFGLKIADNKELTYKIAEENGIRVPKSIYLSKADLIDFNFDIGELQYPVISKPIDGGGGDGVAIDLRSEEDLKKGIEYSFSDEGVERIVIQEQISGDDHRIIVLNGKVIAATKRIPPFVIGNGNNTLQELIDIENQNSLRGKGSDHDAPMSQIRLDSESIEYIRKQGYQLSSVPANGINISLRNNANLSTGGFAIDVTGKIHPSIKNEAEKIANICGLGFCGVDYFCNDITESLKEGAGAIIEINATPGIRMHHFPSQGEPINVAKNILETIF